jgi:hypothetical protein
MTEKEKVIRDIESLRESLRHDWWEFVTKPMERNAIRAHVDACMNELNTLKTLLSKLTPSN